MRDDSTATVIRERLAALERTPAWLAHKLGVHRSLVIRWLRGERPIPTRRLREIELVLGIMLRPAEPAGKAA